MEAVALWGVTGWVPEGEWVWSQAFDWSQQLWFLRLLSWRRIRHVNGREERKAKIRSQHVLRNLNKMCYTQVRPDKKFSTQERHNQLAWNTPKFEGSLCWCVLKPAMGPGPPVSFVQWSNFKNVLWAELATCKATIPWSYFRPCQRHCLGW